MIFDRKFRFFAFFFKDIVLQMKSTHLVFQILHLRFGKDLRVQERCYSLPSLLQLMYYKSLKSGMAQYCVTLTVMCQCHVSLSVSHVTVTSLSHVTSHFHCHMSDFLSLCILTRCKKMPTMGIFVRVGCIRSSH